jgi:hypothetical protein
LPRPRRSEPQTSPSSPPRPLRQAEGLTPSSKEIPNETTSSSSPRPAHSRRQVRRHARQDPAPELGAAVIRAAQAPKLTGTRSARSSSARC